MVFDTTKLRASSIEEEGRKLISLTEWFLWGKNMLRFFQSGFKYNFIDIYLILNPKVRLRLWLVIVGSGTEVGLYLF